MHAAAGGTGSLAVQLGARDGRRAGDRDGVDARRSARSRSSSAPTPRSTARPRASPSGCVEANGGAPVDVVFEMAGGEVFDASLEALAPFGRARHLRRCSGGKTNAVRTRAG